MQSNFAKLLLFFSLLLQAASAQQEMENRDLFYQNEWKNYATTGQQKISINNDTSIDVKFYHLELNIAVDSPYIAGSVYIKSMSAINNLNTVMLNLHAAMLVDSVELDAVSFSQSNNELLLGLAGSYNTGDPVEIKIFYHGIPVLANGIKGLNYSSHGNAEPVIASLSTPFLAHYWWPCKDGPQDKADSVYLDVTIKDSTIGGYPLIAVSNGLLNEVDSSSGINKTFKWRHGYPIVPYYIMVAISNYRIINQSYTGVSSAFPLIYYTFDASYNNALAGVTQIPAVLDRFSQLFGDYPFKNEKYGMTELGFYGAIENQTNTIINTIGPTYFYTSVHELAHQWFGDMITCNDWHHGWLNEGFATYSEALIAEHLTGFSAYKTFMAGAEFYSGGTIYLPADTNPFGIFQAIIYKKGAYVLHMLRGILGDTVFFNSLNTYCNNPQFKYKNATTEDFRQVCENVSGQNLQYFFDQWIYDEYYPKYRFNFYSQPALQKTDLAIYQEQNTVNGWRQVFKMPVQIKFNFANATDTVVTVLNDMQYQNFVFNFNDSVTSIEIDPDKWILKEAVFDPSVLVTVKDLPNNANIFIYPNPATGKVYIYAGDNKFQSLKLEVFNVRGEKVFEQKWLTSNQQNTYTINLSDLNQGIYFMQISSDDKRIIKKIIKI